MNPEILLGSAGDRPFTLPLDALTTAFGIIGRRGSGKTSTGVVLAEEFVERGLPVVILDPLGVWYGLRSSADGEGEGLPVTILGGQHGDLPLEQLAGGLVAELVVEHPGAYVIDISGFESRSAERRFATDFAERLYRLKAKDTTALSLIIDEADTFAPQTVRQGEERLLGAFEAIARRGRARGLGMVLITQRPAVLNKNLLAELQSRWLALLTRPRAAIVEAVIAVYPNDLTKDELAERLGVSPTSGGYFNNLGSLRSLGLIDYPSPGRVVATSLLFPEGLS